VENTDEGTKGVRGTRPAELTDEQISALATGERERASIPDLFANSINGIEALKAERRIKNRPGEKRPVDLDDESVKELASDTEREL